MPWPCFGRCGSRPPAITEGCGYGPLLSQGRHLPFSTFAYLTASPWARFPNTMLSLIRSFVRHPALLSRERR